jgi:hexosaminidase
MDHAVIPAPARFDAGDGPGFAFRPGTVVAYADTAIAPLAGRFCTQVAGRTGLRLAPIHGDRAADEPSVTIELAATPDPGGLPAPAGLSPDGGDPAAERYSLLIQDGRVVLRAAEPAGVARGLTTLLQLVASSREEFRVPAARILDAPRYAWRGLSLDVARTFFTVGEIRRVIDLLELYKLNVLHLHLTDDQAWPLALGRPAAGPEPGAPSYRDDLTFLLLPRLAGVAHRAWSLPETSGWAGHRDRLARHGRLWAQDGLIYFRASTADWT